MDLTVEIVIERVAAIDAEKDDYEAAHGLEDALYLDFAKFVSKSAPTSSSNYLSDIAKEVLKSKEIVFERFTA